MKDLILADFSFKSYIKPIQIKKQSTNKEGCLLKKDKKKKKVMRKTSVDYLETELINAL